MNMGRSRRNRNKTQHKPHHNTKNTGSKKMYSALPSKSSCHTGQRVVYTTHDGIDILAGGKNRQGGWHLASPLPQLAMGPSETMSGTVPSSKTSVPEGWSCEHTLPRPGTPPLRIDFDWPDFSVPRVSAQFWYALVDDIRTHGITRVSTQCAGGHGRTGVQLAILIYLMDPDGRDRFPDAAALIKFVRDIHCVHAVEAKSQQTYIADVCTLPEGKSMIHDAYSVTRSVVPGKPNRGTSAGTTTGTPTSAGLECPVCGNTEDFLGTECEVCTYDVHWETAENQYDECFFCEKMRPSQAFPASNSGESPCGICIHERMPDETIHVSGDSASKVEVLCTDCAKYFPVRQIAAFDFVGETAHCFECDTSNWRRTVGWGE